jgi:hypothetical protein
LVQRAIDHPDIKRQAILQLRHIQVKYVFFADMLAPLQLSKKAIGKPRITPNIKPGIALEPIRGF